MGAQLEPMITGLLVRLGLGTLEDFDAARGILDHDVWLSAIHDGLTELRDARERMLEVSASVDKHRASVHVRVSHRAGYLERLRKTVAKEKALKALRKAYRRKREKK